MKTNYLFPYRFKKLGWVVFIPTLVISIIYLFFEHEIAFFDRQVPAFFSDDFLEKSRFFALIENNVLDEILCFLLIVSGLLLSFSKEKTEDEMVRQIRLESLVWATYANYIVLLCCILFIYGTPFFTVMIYNMFTVLFFFIIRFHWMIYKASKICEDEK